MHPATGDHQLGIRTEWEGEAPAEPSVQSPHQAAARQKTCSLQKPNQRRGHIAFPAPKVVWAISVDSDVDSAANRTSTQHHPATVIDVFPADSYVE
jgi:hypothetical protein